MYCSTRIKQIIKINGNSVDKLQGGVDVVAGLGDSENISHAALYFCLDRVVTWQERWVEHKQSQSYCTKTSPFAHLIHVDPSSHTLFICVGFLQVLRFPPTFQRQRFCMLIGLGKIVNCSYCVRGMVLVYGDCWSAQTPWAKGAVSMLYR